MRLRVCVMQKKGTESIDWKTIVPVPTREIEIESAILHAWSIAFQFLFALKNDDAIDVVCCEYWLWPM